MDTDSNRQVIERIFEGLARGDSSAFRDSLADDVVWRVPGEGVWSGVYAGRESLMKDLLRPVFAQFADTYLNTAENIIVEGDRAVVECRGSVTTKAGRPYNNNYCWVCRFRDGKLVEIVEYMDTALAADVLEPPPQRQARG
ncbi:MAG TPA: nuclear transport factor 2 family protein [Caulobacteraceae bacterium]|nr:nuclear transport factor 2 family protein [Caulobacteraceae bacterium]